MDKFKIHLRNVFGGLVVGSLVWWGGCSLLERFTDHATLLVTSEERGHNPCDYKRPFVGYKSIEVNNGDDVYLYAHAKDSDGLESAVIKFDNRKIPICFFSRYEIKDKKINSLKKSKRSISVQRNGYEISSFQNGSAINTWDYGFITGENKIGLLTRDFYGNVREDWVVVKVRE